MSQCLLENGRDSVFCQVQFIRSAFLEDRRAVGLSTLENKWGVNEKILDSVQSTCREHRDSGLAWQHKGYGGAIWWTDLEVVLVPVREERVFLQFVCVEEGLFATHERTPVKKKKRQDKQATVQGATFGPKIRRFCLTLVSLCQCAEDCGASCATCVRSCDHNRRVDTGQDALRAGDRQQKFPSWPSSDYTVHSM